MNLRNRNIRWLLVMTLQLCASPDLLFAGSATTPPAHSGIKWHPGHYMLLNMKAPRSQLNSIKNEPLIKGAQIRYAWADIEPEKNVYDFRAIEADLQYLESMPVPKRLVIQIMDRGFSKSNRQGIAPPYLLSDQMYQGGLAETRTGYIARIWDPLVMDRLIALYTALAARFDCEPYVEGITTPESAPGFAGRPPADFSNAKLATQLKRLATESQKPWASTNVFLYLNWLGGGLRPIIEHCYEVQCGVGGPDVLPLAPTDGHKIIAGLSGGESYVGKLPIAFSVQPPALCGKEGCNLPADLYKYAVNTLGTNYIFWVRFGTEKDTPTAKYSWHNGILPAIKANSGRINTACPSNYRGQCMTN